MKVISKNIGTVPAGSAGNLHLHLAIVEKKERPFLLFADEDDNPIICVDSKALKKLIRILHLADATSREYERSKDNERQKIKKMRL